MNKCEIRSQVVAQGSYGIRKINPRTGVDRGHVIRVWRVIGPCGDLLDTFPSRAKAREFAARYDSLSDNSEPDPDWKFSLE
jgi:uncharacterized protein (DUF2384 family)